MDNSELLAFVMEHASKATVQKRIRLYRTMAPMCVRPKDRQELLELAECLEAADERSAQLAFAFTQHKG